MAGENGHDTHFLQDFENSVPPGCECPNCAENDADLLVLDEEDKVTCSRCGYRYWIGKRENGS
jgi:Zn ribbon nucleic-acid-binding protein